MEGEFVVVRELILLYSNWSTIIGYADKERPPICVQERRDGLKYRMTKFRILSALLQIPAEC